MICTVIEWTNSYMSTACSALVWAPVTPSVGLTPSLAPSHSYMSTACSALVWAPVTPSVGLTPSLAPSPVTSPAEFSLDGVPAAGVGRSSKSSISSISTWFKLSAASLTLKERQEEDKSPIYHQLSQQRNGWL